MAVLLPLPFLLPLPLFVCLLCHSDEEEKKTKKKKDRPPKWTHFASIFSIMCISPSFNAIHLQSRIICDHFLRFDVPSLSVSSARFLFLNYIAMHSLSPSIIRNFIENHRFGFHIFPYYFYNPFGRFKFPSKITGMYYRDTTQKLDICITRWK